MELAACKIDVDKQFASKIEKFKYEVTNKYVNWLTIVKNDAFRVGTPLKAELLKMVHNDAEELGHAAEKESLGFNNSRLHPDIYMNELLVGMRVIHQTLPAIMKKLGIEDEFELDESDLNIKSW